MPAAGGVDLNVLESVFLGFVKASQFLRDGAGRADLSRTDREPISDALQLETLTLYCAGKISGSETEASLGCDTRGLIALVARHGLKLPHVPQEVAEKMAREALELLGLAP
ncbi:hypothetical protein [Rhodoferax sediminis]|uniref:Uncharacterized protein n=1 Tax=Rhodoferax sediminis TaxID=2509614 RepID=A0A515D7X0_9BURK|nr:hypothetical protein [Rhodoferax sediminis]QDL36457.1 hypothetical protein EUB48_03465 [Rhodoferax sediminis]